jgi:hypothetical protein
MLEAFELMSFTEICWRGVLPVPQSFGWQIISPASLISLEAAGEIVLKLGVKYFPRAQHTLVPPRLQPLNSMRSGPVRPICLTLPVLAERSRMHQQLAPVPNLRHKPLLD